MQFCLHDTVSHPYEDGLSSAFEAGAELLILFKRKCMSIYKSSGEEKNSVNIAAKTSADIQHKRERGSCN